MNCKRDFDKIPFNSHMVSVQFYQHSLCCLFNMNSQILNTFKKLNLLNVLLNNKCKRSLIVPCAQISNGVKLSYSKVEPQLLNETKSPILIFHGLFGNKKNWRSLSKPIADETKRNVYLFDLRNHGDSEYVDGKQSNLNAMADDIKLFLDQNEIQKACLIGHSLGGRVVMQFAFNYQENVDKLIPVDISPISRLPHSFFLAPNFTDELANSIADFGENISLSDARKKVDERMKNTVKDKFIRGFFLMNLEKLENKIVWKYNLTGIKDMLNSDYINQIKFEKPFPGQVLVLHGGTSPYVSAKDYDEIRNIFPNAIFKCINDSGHYLHIEKPKKVLNRLVNFINDSYF